MTEKLKARLQILANMFNAKYKNENPHIRSGKVFKEWYSTRGKASQEPIPKEMLPTEEEYEAWNCREARYMAKSLADYNAKLAYWNSMWGTAEGDVIAEVIAETRPCECREAQCSYFCSRYGKEKCR